MRRTKLSLMNIKESDSSERLQASLLSLDNSRY